MDSKLEHKHKWYRFTCKDATFLLIKGDYSKLSLSEKFLVKTHLLICVFCRRFLKQSKNIDENFRSCAHDSSVHLSPEKKQSLSQLITDNTKK